MPHFLAIPEKIFPQTPDPNFKTLSLYSTSGASIAVWGANSDWKVKTKNSLRFVSDFYRQNGAVAYFTLRGLIVGDEIAAFDEFGSRQTEWMPIVKSAGDKGGAVIRKSRNYPKVTLDARGSAQGFTAMEEEDWLDWVERCLGKIKENPVGRAVMGFILSEVTIMPFLQNEINSDAGDGVIRFTPATFGTDYRPGARPNEMLFHEFCHIAEDTQPIYQDNTSIPFKFDRNDFFTVTATNVYAAVVKRPLRHDHWGFKPLKPAFVGPDGPKSYLTTLKDNFDLLKARKATLYSAIGAVASPWNPFSAA